MQEDRVSTRLLQRGDVHGFYGLLKKLCTYYTLPGPRRRLYPVLAALQDDLRTLAAVDSRAYTDPVARANLAHGVITAEPSLAPPHIVYYISPRAAHMVRKALAGDAANPDKAMAYVRAGGEGAVVLIEKGPLARLSDIPLVRDEAAGTPAGQPLYVRPGFSGASVRKMLGLTCSSLSHTVATLEQCSSLYQRAGALRCQRPMCYS